MVSDRNTWSIDFTPFFRPVVWYCEEETPRWAKPPGLQVLPRLHKKGTANCAQFWTTFIWIGNFEKWKCGLINFSVWKHKIFHLRYFLNGGQPGWKKFKRYIWCIFNQYYWNFTVWPMDWRDCVKGKLN